MDNVLYENPMASVYNSDIVKMDPEDLKACQSWMESVSSDPFFVTPTLKHEYYKNNHLRSVINERKISANLEGTNSSANMLYNNALSTPASPGNLSYASSRSNSFIGDDNHFPLTRSNSNTSSLLDSFESAASWLDADMFSSAPFPKPSFESKLPASVDGLNQRFELNSPTSHTYDTKSPKYDITLSGFSTPSVNHYDNHDVNGQDISTYSSIANSPSLTITCDIQTGATNSLIVDFDLSLPIKKEEEEEEKYSLIKDTPKSATSEKAQPTTTSSNSTPSSWTSPSPSTTSSTPTAPSKKKRGPRKKLTHTQKIAHNKIEKRYRNNINDRILGLRDIIPGLTSDANEADTANNGCENNEYGNMESTSQRLNKSKILEKAVAYILHIQQVNQQLESKTNELSQELLALKSKQN